MKYIIIVLTVSTCLLVSCKGCLKRFYAVHEEQENLDLFFVDSSIKAQTMLTYLDSVLVNDTANYKIEIPNKENPLDKYQRIISFKNYPKEEYRVSIDANPCWIMGIFNKKIDPYHWIYSRSKIKDTELKRIEKRFKDEILSRVSKRASH